MPHRSSPRNHMILFYKKEKIDWSLDIFASFGGVMGDPARQQATKFVNECERPATPGRETTSAGPSADR
jgi:hypothetical protein